MNDNLWLIEKGAFDRIASIQAHLLTNGETFARSPFNDSHDRATGADKAEIIGDKAYIHVSGSLVNDVGWWEWLGNYTRYGAIINMTQQADKNPDVKEIVYVFATPGGLVDGVERCALAIKGTSKKTTALIKNAAYSAGYWLASQCDQIVADVSTSGVGSIGTVVEFLDLSGMYQKMGIKRHTFVSQGSEDKRPDANTKEGQAVYQKIVDTINKSFLGAVAGGRGVSVDHVSGNYGHGGVLFAQDALDVGMIDSIGGLSDSQPSSEQSSPVQSRSTTKASAAKAMRKDIEDGFKASTNKGVTMSDNPEIEADAILEAAGFIKPQAERSLTDDEKEAELLLDAAGFTGTTKTTHNDESTGGFSSDGNNEQFSSVIEDDEKEADAILKAAGLI
ncbi:S49 family peptidase [Photobacterium damselae subsp. damselae]|uniref:S49 family peptidase n=1 Tax=Photobacterium damselae TaxID=38293 RepID=UPI00311AE54D